ncbi:MAG: ABC transporter permease [Bacteroidales bacterium]|jgi:putative ABC transport system permease protein|nr:ABC transporter permease [Bacteroidales bacterium]
MKVSGLLLDNLKISVDSIRSNSLRTILTVLIIAIGIMALVGILTAVEAIKSTISNEFIYMGANTFSIRRLRSYENMDGRVVSNPVIKYEDATKFKDDFTFPARVSIHVEGTGSATVKYEDIKTNPTISVYGVDENYLITSGEFIADGRNFTSNEVLSGDNLVIIGNQLKTKLFGSNNNAIEEYIFIGNLKYRITGILEDKGSAFGEGGNTCLIPLNSARKNFNTSYNDYIINVMPDAPGTLDLAVSEAEGVFRNVRKLTVYDINNFQIRKSDSMVARMLENISVLTIGSSVIGLITLLGASIGLMNIMLVSVSERTREVGIRKALGAKSETIKQQFLFESVFIGQLGGALGIVLGVIAGNIITLFTGGSFVVPWLWVFIGVLLCFVVGIASGYIPAVKASKLEPIEALHYE